jgi:predicted  nucleic acid-binding Zn-ribbon protein
MLNEIQHLSDTLGRILLHADQLAADNQRLRAALEEAQADAARMREEREAMTADRELLNAKIEEAQQRIQTILDKLPTAADTRQLDLLQAPTDGGEPPRSGDTA